MSLRNFLPVSILICGLLAGGFGPFKLLAQPDFANNSMVKNRVQPGPQASRIGSAVQWQPDLETALAKSRETGKPVFWYVPTLRGSFMDRTSSIDQYMMAGPFSWPDIISVLNEHFIPVKARPNRKQQKQFELMPYVFVEPGFVILAPGGEVTTKLDRITTLHPKWFRSLLTQSVLQPIQPESKPDALTQLWRHFEDGNYDRVVVTPSAKGSATAVEEMLLAGMADFRRGDHASAKQKWQTASKLQPEHPLAWKAAAEAEGIGPFVRGFEIHRAIPANALQAGVKSVGSSAPANVFDEPELWQRGSEFLLTMQNRQGGFTDSDYDFGGTDSLPNVHVAVTSLAGMAMLEAAGRDQLDSLQVARLEKAISNAASYVCDNGNINLADRDELLWACAYRVRFIARMTTKDRRYQQTLQTLVKDLERIQSRSGSWFHEYRNPFVTATALLAL